MSKLRSQFLRATDNWKRRVARQCRLESVQVNGPRKQRTVQPPLSFSIPLRIGLVFLFTIVTTIVSGQEGTSDSTDAKLIRGLRARHLYHLAEIHCRTELGKPNLTPTKQTSLLIELIRTQSSRAGSLTGTDRETAWQAAEKTATEFLDANSNHPKRILVQIQLALSHVTKAKLIGQEIAAEIAEAGSRDEALIQLRNARSILGKSEREIDRLIPLQRGREVGPDELSFEQLSALKRNVRYQLAVCSLNQAQLYDPSDQLNRVDALNVVLKRLEEVRRETGSDQPIWWRVQLAKIQCLRAASQFEIAAKEMDKLPVDEASPEFREQIIRERLLLSTGANAADLASRFSAALGEPIRTPELQLAMIEAARQMSGRTSDQAARERWQNTAVQLARETEARHGAYWGRRAELTLIGKATDPSSVTTTGTNSNIEVLISVGNQATRKGNFADAVKAYDKAITAIGATNPERKFTVGVRAAQATQNLKKYGDAARRMLELSNASPGQKLSPTVHITGCWNFAQTMGNEAEEEKVNQFLNHLQQHVKTWPNSETSNQALMWLAAQHQKDKQWEAAAENYLKVSPTSPFAETAAKYARGTAGLAVKQSGMESELRAQTLANQFCESFWTKASQLSAKSNAWTETSSQYLLGASALGFKNKLQAPTFDQVAVEKSLQAAIATEPPLSRRNELMARLIVSVTSRGEADEGVDDVNNGIASLGSDLDSLTECVNGFKLSAERIASKEIRERIAGYQLKVVEQALKINQTEAQQTSWLIRKSDALRIRGDDEQAMSVLQQLAKRLPKDARVQMELARSAAAAGSAEIALNQWRRVAGKLKPNSENWFEAKLQIATLLHQTGKAEDALKLLEYMKAIPPGWNQSKWKRDFDQLLIRCQN